MFDMSSLPLVLPAGPIPREVGKLSALEWMHLDRNRLTDECSNRLIVSTVSLVVVGLRAPSQHAAVSVAFRA